MRFPTFVEPSECVADTGEGGERTVEELEVAKLVGVDADLVEPLVNADPDLHGRGVLASSVEVIVVVDDGHLAVRVAELEGLDGDLGRCWDVG